MEVDFTLQNVVNFMEAHGFHVQKAEEILDKEGVIVSVSPEQREIAPIRLTIAPKAAKHSPISFS